MAFGVMRWSRRNFCDSPSTVPYRYLVKKLHDPYERIKSVRPCCKCAGDIFLLCAISGGVLLKSSLRGNG